MGLDNPEVAPDVVPDVAPLSKVRADQVAPPPVTNPPLSSRTVAIVTDAGNTNGIGTHKRKSGEPLESASSGKTPRFDAAAPPPPVNGAIQSAQQALQLSAALDRLNALPIARKELMALRARPEQDQHRLALDFVHGAAMRLQTLEARQLLEYVASIENMEPQAHGCLCWHLSLRSDPHGTTPLRALVERLTHAASAQVARVAYGVSQYCRGKLGAEEIVDNWIEGVEAQLAKTQRPAKHSMAMDSKAQHPPAVPLPCAPVSSHSSSSMATREPDMSTPSDASHKLLISGSFGIALSFGATGLASEERASWKLRVLGPHWQSRTEDIHRCIEQGINEALVADRGHGMADAAKYRADSHFRQAIRLPGSMQASVVAQELLKAVQIENPSLLGEVLLELVHHGAPEMATETFEYVRQALLTRLASLVAAHPDDAAPTVELISAAYRTYLGRSAVACAFNVSAPGPDAPRVFSSMEFQLSGFLDFVRSEMVAISESGLPLKPVLDMLGRRKKALETAIALGVKYEAAPGAADRARSPGTDDDKSSQAYDAAKLEVAQLEFRLGIIDTLPLSGPPAAGKGRGRRSKASS
ncbi:MAG TPA: hypothetical protein VLJ86_07935 [Ramlibacter sp.]|nr:hypothetical protein [Ramlibacter sp.]